MRKAILLVFLGGGLGAMVRELLMLGVLKLPNGFPLATFLANMTAALLIGLVAALARSGGPIGPGLKLFLATGIMGGLSTFSSWMWGTLVLLRTPSERSVALVYLGLSLAAGLALVLLGWNLGLWWCRPDDDPLRPRSAGDRT